MVRIVVRVTNDISLRLSLESYLALSPFTRNVCKLPFLFIQTGHLAFFARNVLIVARVRSSESDDSASSNSFSAK